ncbi:MAG: hypothetical protein EXS63_09380 [Candidatus Omnitrophica bacterium]|nr:hypothetical protein [Candidatus Omnitrophota bacterium]
MTHLLQQAFARASKLPAVEQNAFARWVLEELVSERRWEKAFSESEDALSKLADAALREHKRGKTKPINPDAL